MNQNWAIDLTKVVDFFIPISLFGVMCLGMMIDRFGPKQCPRLGYVRNSIYLNLTQRVNGKVGY